MIRSGTLTLTSVFLALACTTGYCEDESDAVPKPSKSRDRLNQVEQTSREAATGNGSIESQKDLSNQGIDTQKGQDTYLEAGGEGSNPFLTDSALEPRQGKEDGPNLKGPDDISVPEVGRKYTNTETKEYYKALIRSWNKAFELHTQCQSRKAEMRALGTTMYQDYRNFPSDGCTDQKAELWSAIQELHREYQRLRLNRCPQIEAALKRIESTLKEWENKHRNDKDLKQEILNNQTNRVFKREESVPRNKEDVK